MLNSFYIIRDHHVTLLSGFTNDVHTDTKIEDIAPAKVVEYITKYSNRDLLGARMKGELPIPILEVFRYPLEVKTVFFSQK